MKRIPEFSGWMRWAPALALAILLGACAATGKNAESVVSERAQARWDALLADEVETAWGYFSPGYRSGLSLSAYYRRLAAMRLRYTDAKVIESDCSEKVCKVTISVDYSVFGAVPGVERFDTTAPVVENWILTEGAWYFLPEN